MSEVKILDGNTFVVSDNRGDIDASPADSSGLFSFDTRFLSRWILTVNGQRLNPLSVNDLQYYETRFFLFPGTGTVYVDATLSVIRQRAVANGFVEELTLLNHKNEPVDVTVRLDAGSDFADLFEVKDALTKKGEYYTRVEKNRLILGYRRETFTRETAILAGRDCTVDEHGLTFQAHIEPHGSWVTDLRVSAGLGSIGQDMMQPDYQKATSAQRSLKENVDKWISEAPRLECDWDPLKITYRRSIVDLAALRFSPVSLPGHYLPAAGLP